MGSTEKTLGNGGPAGEPEKKAQKIGRDSSGETGLSSATEQKKPRLRIPHIYVILSVLILVVAAATYVIPAGEYERVEGPDGREVIVPDSFQTVDADPVGMLQLMMAVPNGLMDAGEVVFFTLIVGGMFMVLRRTGIIELGVGHLTTRFAERSLLIIPVLMVLFASVAAFIGTPELSLVYIPVLLPLMLALGYDSITAAGVVLVATASGFTAALTNPGTIGLGQQIANLPLYSGIGLRSVIFLVMLTIGIAYVLRYAKKVKQYPRLSLVYDEDQLKKGEQKEAAPYTQQEQEQNQQAQHQQEEHHQSEHQQVGDQQESPQNGATKHQKRAAAAVVVFFGILIYGVLAQGWFMLELSGLFIVMSIVVGLLGNLKTSDICEAFNDGLKSVLMGAFIIGLARGVAVMMEEGRIMDTIVFGLGEMVSFLPGTLAALGMLIVQLLFNFLMPSGSGQAVITMPIMAPLADILGVTRQTAVLAFQFGDGLSNILYPTSGYFMATLALAGVGWDKWVRFFLPLFFVWVCVAVVFLMVVHMMNWGPF